MESEHNEIVHLSENPTPDLHEIVHYSEFSSQSDYISQFLELENFQSKHSSQDGEIENNLPISKEVVLPSTQIAFQSSKPQNLPEKKKKSIFHNFQKHLVTTLRGEVKIKRNGSLSERQSLLINKIWQQFVKSAQYTKRLLYLLFGVAEDNDQKVINEIQKIISSDGTSEDFTLKEIYEAQSYLRNQVSKQGKKLVAKNIFKNRRMQKSEEFEKYFLKFLEELEEGPIRKRLPKVLKIQLLQQMHDQNHF